MTQYSFMIQQCDSFSFMFPIVCPASYNFTLFDFSLSFFFLWVFFLFTYDLIAPSYAYITEIIMLIRRLTTVFIL